MDVVYLMILLTSVCSGMSGSQLNIVERIQHEQNLIFSNMKGHCILGEATIMQNRIHSFVPQPFIIHLFIGLWGHTFPALKEIMV